MSQIIVGDLKFVRTKYDALDGNTTVAFSEQSSDFKIMASKKGLWFEGKMNEQIFGEKALQAFAKLISDAWEDHRKLKPKILTSTSGH